MNYIYQYKYAFLNLQTGEAMIFSTSSSTL